MKKPGFTSSLYLLCLLLFASIHIQAQVDDTIRNEKYNFKQIKVLPATSVKDQSATGTCWSYATTSFLESEILRIKHDTVNLSEMFFVRKNYEDKAMRYIRQHGAANFGEGGQAHDVINVMRNYGVLTDEAYSGLANGQTEPNHGELVSVLKAMLDALVKNPAGRLSPEWMQACNSVLNVYLGEVPESMLIKGKTVSPAALRDLFDLNADNYIELTSYSHHPFYSKFILEVPDNWSMGEYYNVPLDDLIRVIDNSLENGYTVDWDGDVSDRGFSHKKGVAIVPDVKLTDAAGTDRIRWESLSEKERRKQFYSFDNIVPEKNVTQEMRQAAFDNYSATDDHLMHITGYATDQHGNRYYLTKNSWSAESNDMGGYLYLSVPYIKLNTIALMVHKDAIPKDLQRKLRMNQ